MSPNAPDARSCHPASPGPPTTFKKILPPNAPPRLPRHRHLHLREARTAMSDGIRKLWSVLGERCVERMRQPLQIHRPGEQTRVPELAPGSAAQEPPQLRNDGLTTPLGLPLEAAERAEISLRINKRFNPGGADRADQLVLQILDADVKAELLHVGPRAGRADSGARQTAPHNVLLADVA